MTITVYGASDDLIEIEGAIREEFPALGDIENDNEGGYLCCSDGTILKIIYDNDGVWRITPHTAGRHTLDIVQAPVGDDDDNYSDRATLTSLDDGHDPIVWVALASQVATA